MKKTDYNRKNEYVRKTHRHGRRRRKSMMPVFIIAIIAVAGSLIFFVSKGFIDGNNPKSSSSTNSSITSYVSGESGESSEVNDSSLSLNSTQESSISHEISSEASNGSETSTSSQIGPIEYIPTAIMENQNPILLTDKLTKFLSMGSILSELLPSALGYETQVYSSGNPVSSFNRSNPIRLYDPIDYGKIPGVLSFRGNNFRNAPSYGHVEMKSKKLQQIWERSMGGMPSSRWAFSWSGTGWTGQPVMVQWPEDIRMMMNIKAEKKSKKGLVEVITASMDGNIYFYDLDDGKSTRPAINIGVAVKGTPAIDPRGYPILYVGQGDYPPKKSSTKMGFRIFNLIDQSLMLFKDTSRDSRAYRSEWGSMDSSPIIDGDADTLVYPNENGIIYTAKLNTVFDKAAGKITINPVFTDYRYRSSVNKSSQGIESSIAVYGSYGYFSDNSGSMNCVDLNTMKPIWTRKLDDDNDVTPTLQQEGDNLYLYCGTEVDNQKAIDGTYKGNAYIYKINAMTGAVVWRNSYSAWTLNNTKAAGNDVNGGIMGSVVVGKGRFSNLIIASICMSEGFSSGNTVAAFKSDTGELAWEYKMKNYSWSSPVDVYDTQGNMYLLIADSISQIHLIDGSNGAKLDVIQVKSNFLNENAAGGGNIESSPTVLGNTLVIGTRGGLIAGVRLK